MATNSAVVDFPVLGKRLAEIDVAGCRGGGETLPKLRDCLGSAPAPSWDGSLREDGHAVSPVGSRKDRWQGWGNKTEVDAFGTTGKNNKRQRECHYSSYSRRKFNSDSDSVPDDILFVVIGIRIGIRIGQNIKLTT